MRSAANLLGRHLHAVTDSETGERDQWIGWQLGKLTSIDGIEVVGVKKTSAPDNEEYSGFPAIAVDSSVTELPRRALGYADAAEASYPVFEQLRADDVVPDGVKFQVSVPTAYASVVAWVREEDQQRFFDVYERAIAAEVEDIVAAVRPADLVIQWDVAVEIGALNEAFAASGGSRRSPSSSPRSGAARDAPRRRRARRPPLLRGLQAPALHRPGGSVPVRGARERGS